MSFLADIMSFTKQMTNSYNDDKEDAEKWKMKKSP